VLKSVLYFSGLITGLGALLFQFKALRAARRRDYYAAYSAVQLGIMLGSFRDILGWLRKWLIRQETSRP
jgi:hypothetical protein